MKAKLLLALTLLSLFLTPSYAQRKSVKAAFAPVQTNVANNLPGLPIKRVILYSNGVAYIERRGIVSGNAEVNLSFKQSQVDDVLKSMVVLDLGQGRIGAVSYNSSAPTSSRTAEIPFTVDAQSGQANGIAGVLAQLQGAKVAVNTAKGVTVTGSILTVEKRQVQVDSNKPSLNKNFLVISSEGGEISSFDLDEVRSVKLMDEGTRRDVSEFATATASARRRDAKTISVTSAGAGQREMVVSYIIAAPIWKTTYRVVLDQEGKPFFQGWAIVDNISDEDWTNVQLSLVSGSPVSFIQPIQQPFYRYRPVVPMPSDLKLSPQVYEEGTNYSVSSDAIGGIITDPAGAVIPNANVTIINNSTGQQYSLRTNNDGTFTQSGLSAGNYRVMANAPGFKTVTVNNARPGIGLNVNLEVGNVSETVTISADQIANLPINGRRFESLLKLAPGTVGEFRVNGASGSENNFTLDGADFSKSRNTTVSDALLGNKSGVDTAATGGEIGDLFEYKIEQPVTVNRDRSALIPIVQTKMEGERISIYNESVRRDRPMGGMKLVNTSPLTLEGGSLTVLDKDAYAGEALMERLKPKEERLISYALDLGTSVTVRQTAGNSPAKLLKVVDGVLQFQYFREEKKNYIFQNQTDRPRVVYVEYPVRSGWKLSDDTPPPVVTTQGYYRFRVELKALEKQEITISEQQNQIESYGIANITQPQIEIFLTRQYINEATKQRLEKLIEIRRQINQIDVKLQGFKNEENQISADQARLRENIEALSKTPEAKTLITRYIDKVNTQESRLEQITKEREGLQADRQKLENDLAQEIRLFTI